jgi:fluoride ion exporter CrcB/FEX
MIYSVSGNKLSGLAIAMAVALLPLGALPVLAALPQPAPARSPDLRVTATVSHGPGAAPAANRVAIPLRRVPMQAGGPAVSAPQSAAVLTPKAAVSATADQQGLVAGNSSPSDSTGAIGPLHYIEMINSQVGMFDRTLTPVGSPVDLAVFIGAAANANAYDPQIQWDQQAGRWFYVTDESYNNFTVNKLAFGWSKGGDASGLTLANTNWCNFHIATANDLHDYPKLGHDTNFMLVGANVFANPSGKFISAAIWAIPKPAAGDTSCTVPTATEFIGTSTAPLMHLPPDAASPILTPVPSNAADSASTAYISAIDIAYIGIWHVSPTAVGSCTTPPCLVGDGEVPITAWTPPPTNIQRYPVPQRGGPTVDGLDGRLTQAVQHSDPKASGAEGVWTQHTSAGAGGRTVVTWFELIPSLCASAICGTNARHQEGVVSSPSLYLFNGAISPTSHGDAAVIHYNTSSSATLIDVRAQSRGAADPLNVMSGETVLRTSTVAENDFTCIAPPLPCRWGDYAGASPDPTSCSLVWGTNMLSGDIAAGGGAPKWVTQNFALSEGRVRSAVSTQQYVYTGSDGQTWQDLDASRLQLVSAPCADMYGLISANADLFTSSAGVNQDLAVFVDVDGVPSLTPLAWKESGGFNGTFSPNAAYVQGAFPMPAGHTYTVRLKWKAGIATGGKIYAGAGPIATYGYSPTRLILQLFPTAPPMSVIMTQQTNMASDGVNWIPIPGISPVSLAPSVNSRVVLGGNADLWTDTAGFNQDIGINISGGAFGVAGQLLAWKESGGFNGTYSPNAAFVQATANLTGGTTYSAKLVWKTNRPAPANASIYAGAGPLSGPTTFSTTSLSAVILPGNQNPFESVITTQPVLPNSNGALWLQIGGVQLTVMPAASTDSIVSANADLWTGRSGFNQDIGVFVTDNGGPQQLLVWKESGGFGGTASPNAAFAETFFPMVAGHAYAFLLKWKTNRSASGATIYAGAGPISGLFSPTRLMVELIS